MRQCRAWGGRIEHSSTRCGVNHCISGLFRYAGQQDIRLLLGSHAFSGSPTTRDGECFAPGELCTDPGTKCKVRYLGWDDRPDQLVTWCDPFHFLAPTLGTFAMPVQSISLVPLRFPAND